MSKEASVLAAVYPQLAVKTLEDLAQHLTLLHRNDSKNPVLSTALRAAATRALAAHGVTGQEHVEAVANLAADAVHAHLPAKLVEIQEIPNVERTKTAFAQAKRDYLIDMLGQAPMELLAGFMLMWAAELAGA